MTVNDKPRKDMDEADRTESARQAQNAVHKALSRYVNGAIFSRGDVMRASLVPVSPLRRHAARMIRMVRDYRGRFVFPAAARQDIDIEPYRGKNPHVYRMMEYLARNLGDDVTGAYVHGSVGTYEETAYSDFDALVILSMDVFESPGRLIRVADRLRRAKTIMYEFDPLQHHGWFVLTEDDLSFHCEAHFPAALFRHCKSLIEDKGRRVSIASRDSRREIDDILKAVAGSVVDKLERGKQPENVYQLKCLTSEFMLLPALHVQRKTAAGEYKKYCFDEARRDFSPEVWQIMDEVSQLRLEWDYRLRPWQRRIATREHVLRDLYVRNQAPAIPGHMQARLTPDFYANMLRLAIQFRDRF